MDFLNENSISLTKFVRNQINEIKNSKDFRSVNVFMNKQY